ncbi:MAG: DUF5655 domain-containing protein [Chloroflexota bacterium]
MSKLNDAAQKMAENLQKKTGKSLVEWVTIARQSGIEKHGELLKYLKGEHGLTHGYANMVSMQSRKSDDGEEPDFIEAQYAGAKAALKPIYDAILNEVEEFGADIELAPKKAYMSLRRNKQFAIVQPSTKTRVDVGINLKGDTPTDRLETSGSFNSMVSHRVRLTTVEQVDAELISWLKEAYERA